ncbi:hypothetical protein TREPR_3106 [Treponema primitia ZAS-2]|uniref:Uncharacterized protein n=1 Tax=Treponema primitia (strain ATCC BAA-887 / DSM 12427 / ZAS-2) TaxID=545694 RepID=F5YMK3_TREPZ|nr:hypothetical protein [Treponema primitia]AEF86482.1 hypothetical protein TREPR_3106 [Treponema primitia ZAS-2]
MKEKLNQEFIENISKIIKGGKQAAIEVQKRYGNIIKKEEDKYGNITLILWIIFIIIL